METTPVQWIVGASLLGLIVAAVVLWKPLRRRRRLREEAQAFETFRIQREQLEAKFFDLAAGIGKPRGLRWRECDWQSGVVFARDVQSDLLTAFVAVNIHFEAIAGGEMEDVEAVGLLRDAAALFHFRQGRWGTGGKALFNMNPHDALTRLEGQFVPVELKPRPSASPRSSSGIH